MAKLQYRRALQGKSAPEAAPIGDLRKHNENLAPPYLSRCRIGTHRGIHLLRHRRAWPRCLPPLPVAGHADALFWWRRDHLFFPRRYTSRATIAGCHSGIGAGRILAGAHGIDSNCVGVSGIASDALLGTKMNLGVADTLADLLLGLVGGVVMVLSNRIPPLSGAG